MNLALSVALGLLAYVAASINFSILILKLIGKGDPRLRFSGNPGAFNVYRQTNWAWAALVLLLDMGRAALIALLGLLVLPIPMVPLIAIGMIVGNHYPCFHDFRGGKGVGHYLGFAAIISPWATLLSLPVWVIIYKFTKETFIGSFAMLAVLALGMLIRCQWDLIAVIGVMTSVGLICYFHRPNIVAWQERRKGRLIQG